MPSQAVNALLKSHRELLSRPNAPCGTGSGVYQRWQHPVLTRAHVPPSWRYDFDEQSNPFCLERLGVNAVFNSGAIYLDGVYSLVVRVEGSDRKSFFALAQSKKPTEGFAFIRPIVLPDTQPEEVNAYDMRLTQHADGWIYGLFCSERKDPANPEPSAAVAACGIVRTKDLLTWERLPNLRSRSPQQRNVVLLPDFVDGKYALFTRPQDGFIEAGSGGGICFALCEDMERAAIEEERLVSPRRYHSLTEGKNGAGATPVKTTRGWLHIAHGARGTAAGLRYVLYVFVTDLNEPWKVTAAPSGVFLAPLGAERVGDVSNVVFSSGAALNQATGELAIYYASSDTRLHVATTTLEKMLDYAFETPRDPGRSADCVRQREALILKNRALLEYERWLAEVPADSPWRAGLEALGADGAGRFDAFRCGLAFGTGGLRAEIGPGSNRMNHYVVGRATQGLANYLKKAYPGQSLLVCIAHDTRHCSAEFAAHAACALCAAGIRVKRFPQPRPTPMLSFAVREYKAQAGIVITASHNPKEYNGYKVYGETGGQLTDAAALAVLEEIDKLDLFEAARATEKMTQALALQKGLLGDLGDEADELYYEKSSAFLPRRAFTRQNAAKLKLIYSPLHGSGLVPVTRLLKKLDYAQLRVVPEQEQPDGDFPTVAKPNPEERDTFLLAMELAKTVQPDVIFATDPDADRLGVLAQNDRGEFEVLSGTQTGALLCDYLIQAYRERPGGLPPNPAIVTTVVTGTLAERICKANGVAVKKVLTGFKYIGETMDAWQANGAHSFLFGFEESYGYLTGDVCRDKDAVIAAALVAEMALYYKLEKNKTLYQALQELYQSYGPVCEALVNLDAKGADGQVFIAGLMKNIRENYAAVLPGETVLFLEDYLAGERRDLQTGVCSAIDLPRSDVVKLFFADGAWLVLRPSGTEPKIKLYLCTGDAFAPGESLDEARRRVEALAQKAKALLG